MQRSIITGPLFVAVAACFTTGLAACSSSESPTPETNGTETSTTETNPVVQPTRVRVEQLVPQFSDHATRRVQSAVAEDAMHTRLATEAKRSWNARIAGGLKYADLLLQIYEESGWALAFASAGGLTPSGEAIVARLQRADVDALDNSAYHLEIIAEHGAILGDFERVEPPTLALTGAEAETLVRWLDAERDPDARALHELVDRVLGLDGQPALSPRLAEVAAQYRAALEPQARSMVEAELRVADAALRFARDMRHFNYKRLSWRELEDAGGGKAVVYSRLQETLLELFDAADPDETTEVLDALRPGLVQYDRLLDALQRYRAMTPWAPLAAIDLQSATGRAQLTARLDAEGYDTSNLEAALNKYRETHQFMPDSQDPGVLRSLNVDLARRTRQIELTLQRYRETFYRDELDYVFVNIPDFHAEVYRNGELRKRFRVVVGNTERVCDVESNTWRYVNATPVQWAPLDHLMLNPWWNVPPRLFREEIEPRLNDTAWLASKGYEVYERNGRKAARQRPGAQNALGKVKFIFPNEHDTYMHDTPSKQYFSRPTRAFSHGCVRVEDPLDLAEYFMTEYDLGGAERMSNILELGRTIKIEIPGEIPVIFEYYTVRVDDAGDTWFLADPYRLDEVPLGLSDGSCVVPAAPAESAPPEQDAHSPAPSSPAETDDALAADEMPSDEGP